MNVDLIRFIITLSGAYMVYKTRSASKSGTFLTLFGYVVREVRPRTFKVCILAGWMLAVALIAIAVFTNEWLPTIANL